MHKLLNSVYFCVRDQFKTEKPVPSAQRVEIEQEEQRSDTASAVLQDELIQAAVREQLQMELDKMKDDFSQLQMWIKQRPNLQQELEREQEMKQRESGFGSVFIARQHTDIANLSVCPSVSLSVRYDPVSDENGLTYRHSFFTVR